MYTARRAEFRDSGSAKATRASLSFMPRLRAPRFGLVALAVRKTHHRGATCQWGWDGMGSRDGWDGMVVRVRRNPPCSLRTRRPLRCPTMASTVAVADAATLSEPPAAMSDAAMDAWIEPIVEERRLLPGAIGLDTGSLRALCPDGEPGVWHDLGWRIRPHRCLRISQVQGPARPHQSA